jgi:hypothetical protein
VTAAAARVVMSHACPSGIDVTNALSWLLKVWLA